MGNEVLLEVIDHRHQLAKRLFVTAMAHQQLLSAKHFRNFGQHGGATVGNHIVGETSQHRVSRDAGQAVRPAAFQTKLQLAQFTRLTLIVAHHVVQLMEMFYPRLHFVFLMLADHEVHAFRIELAQRFAEGIHLVVFTTKPHHQHRPRVRVTHHVLQHGAGVDVIVTQLRAAVGVAEKMNAIDAFSIVGLFQEAGLHLTRHGVNAADGRQDPQFVTHPDIAVGTTVDLHIAICRLYLRFLKVGLIAIFIQIAQIGARIVSMDMFTRRNIRQSMANRQAIFNDVLTLSNIAQGKFVSTYNVLS